MSDGYNTEAFFKWASIMPFIDETIKIKLRESMSDKDEEWQMIFDTIKGEAKDKGFSPTQVYKGFKETVERQETERANMAPKYSSIKLRT